ncbi:MAG: hypothetical protein ABI129_01340 [Rhodanobacter sp.]
MQTHVTTLAYSIRRSWLVRAAGALLALGTIGVIAAIPTPAHAGVFVSINIAPPMLPVYEQPMIPGDGYIWTPGYWAWSGDGYYWVPGTWVQPPFIGGLWTPGYWGWGGGVYEFHRGYWGRHVGFYGGIDYGYGYGGNGYEGGYWRDGGFYYNRSVNRVDVNIRNVYNRTVINNTTIINNRTSFNGGPRGIAARATPQQAAWRREQHTAPVAAQLRQRDMASRMPSLRASANHGVPPIAATARAGDFRGHDVVAAHGARAAMSRAAARDSRDAPREATTRTDGAMRSANFAHHEGQSIRPTNAGRFNTPAQERRNSRPDESRVAPREATTRTDGALRSANFANHEGQSMRPTNAGRYDAQAQGRQNARPDESRAAPREASTRADGGMRSANFANHEGQSMRPTDAGRYNAQAQERRNVRPDESRAASRESQPSRNTEYRPQNVGATQYQPQVPRQARNDMRENQRPPNQRPAAEHEAASRGHAAPAEHPRREDDKHHR